MMKIFTASQIKEWDEDTILEQGISSLQLMERAANVCAKWIVENFDLNYSVVVFCGNGNNGGDGFAIARFLFQKGYDVNLFVDPTKTFSENALINFKKCKEISGIQIFNFDQVSAFKFEENTIIIDALFGTGLNRKTEGKFAEIIKYLNDVKRTKVSIDIPSGLMTDIITEKSAVVFKADHTLTFQTWKRSLLHPETGRFGGKVHVLNIDLSDEFQTKEFSNYFVIDDIMIKKIYQPRKEFSHKGTYGSVTIIAGSYGKMGAAVIATKAALRSGSGLTFILAPNCGYNIIQTTSPEAMFINGGENELSNFCVEDDSVFGIGPGIGTSQITSKTFLQFLKKQTKPVVIDADALNIISQNPSYFKFIPENSIFTPHPKEFERLFGKTENSFERLEPARQKAEELQIIIVLKDHHTQVIMPDGSVFYNITGNSGMAKGGSGDALLGIITSLLAQNYSPQNAAIFGVWLHGKAGDFAAEKFSNEAMLPSDLINELGNVFKSLQ